MATPQISTALKATGKNLMGLPGLMLVAGAAGDYSTRRNNGSSASNAAIMTTLTNVLPNLLLTGPRGTIYTALIYGLPMVPAIAQALAATSASRESILRGSAMPFNYHGYAPTMGAIQAMQRASETATGMRGLSQAHAGLAAQAMRR